MIYISIYYVYILETTSSTGRKSFYTGYTNNLQRRLKQHKEGKGAKYCNGKEKIELKYFETFLERHEAMKREKEIKSLTRVQKLALLNNFINS